MKPFAIGSIFFMLYIISSLCRDASIVESCTSKGEVMLPSLTKIKCEVIKK